MSGTDRATRERILAAAMELLQAEADPDRITVRQLAEAAGVAVGAINYHFRSKENLLNLAVGRLMGEVAAAWYQPLASPEADPVTRLRNLLKESGRIAFRYRKLAAISASYELMSGNLDVPGLILPLLRQILGDRKSELELRLMAFQLIVTAQVALLRADAFKRYSGVDLTVEADREALIDRLVDLDLGIPHSDSGGN